MKITKTESVTREETVTISRTCDICGEPCADGFTDVELQKRTTYPECGKVIEYDVCVTCFDTKIAKLMKNPPQERSW